MKVKLLKKIRKQYSIVYYHNTGWYRINFGNSSDWDIIDVNLCSSLTIKDRLKDGGYNESKTLQGAKDKLMNYVRIEYNKYTRKYKLSQKNIKVWYNEK